ncbi:MAG: glycosyltransferase [Bacteroidales bacterium]|nr:glycosyltransferase [Bacteroidales bacterium]
MPSDLVSSAVRPRGISVYMRIKDERDWIAASIASVKGIADEIIIVDNGSTDGTYEILQEIARREKGFIKLMKKPELHHCDLSNFALGQTSFRWVFRWDGDMVAHTDGEHPISELRARILALNPRHYYLVYLRHTNLSGDLFHQDPQEMVHIEEYVHTFSKAARFIHPGRFEAVKFPFYYKPLFWYEPYVFHVNVKPVRRMLLRYFWEEWMELKDYVRYPRLEDYVSAKIETEFGTFSMEEAQGRCVKKMLQNHIHFNAEKFGPYPEMLRPLLEKTPYRIQYQDGRISGRTEPENRI